MAGADGREVPARQKFLLADRLQATAPERLVEAAYTKGRPRLPVQANLGVEKLRFRHRLAMDHPTPGSDSRNTERTAV